MYAIPPRLETGVAQVTGVSCPDCGGVLKVWTEGRDATLVFECRIGHTFDALELLAAKEERVEEHLWSANRVLEELAQLLVDLAKHASEHGDNPASMDAYRLRAARAKEIAGAVRGLMERSRPVDLAHAEPGAGAGGDPRADGREGPGKPGRA